MDRVLGGQAEWQASEQWLSLHGYREATSTANQARDKMYSLQWNAGLRVLGALSTVNSLRTVLSAGMIDDKLINIGMAYHPTWIQRNSPLSVTTATAPLSFFGCLHIPTTQNPGLKVWANPQQVHLLVITKHAQDLLRQPPLWRVLSGC